MTSNLDPIALAHEYRLARLRILDIVEELVSTDPALSLAAVPACPAWTVHDLVAHVSGIATEIAANNMPGEDSDAWVDALVESRRSMSLRDLVDEWTASGPIFESLAATNKRLAVPLTYDTVVHEHDLRHAVKRAGARDSSGVVAAMHVGVWLMTNDLKRHDFGAVRFVAGGRAWECGEGDVRLALDLDSEGHRYPVWELLRLTGSRRSRDQIVAHDWSGNVEEALPALLHMELPLDDLDE